MVLTLSSCYPPLFLASPHSNRDRPATEMPPLRHPFSPASLAPDFSNLNSPSSDEHNQPEIKGSVQPSSLSEFEPAVRLFNLARTISASPATIIKLPIIFNSAISPNHPLSSRHRTRRRRRNRPFNRSHASSLAPAVASSPKAASRSPYSWSPSFEPWPVDNKARMRIAPHG